MKRIIDETNEEKVKSTLEEAMDMNGTQQKRGKMKYLDTVTNKSCMGQAVTVYVSSKVEPSPTRKYAFRDYWAAREFANVFSDDLETAVEISDFDGGGWME